MKDVGKAKLESEKALTEYLKCQQELLVMINKQMDLGRIYAEKRAEYLALKEDNEPGID